jgi:8-oxo-dGTP diphosphatase
MRERKTFDVLPAKWHYPELSSLLLKYKEEIEE